MLPEAPNGQGEVMKKSRFTEEQIIYALRLADSGKAVVDVCRQLGVSDHVIHVEERNTRTWV